MGMRADVNVVYMRICVCVCERFSDFGKFDPDSRFSSCSPCCRRRFVVFPASFPTTTAHFQSASNGVLVRNHEHL